MCTANAVAVRICPNSAEEVVACLACIDCRVGATAEARMAYKSIDSSCIRNET
jgi:hypothetical protein